MRAPACALPHPRSWLKERDSKPLLLLLLLLLLKLLMKLALLSVEHCRKPHSTLLAHRLDVVLVARGFPNIHRGRRGQVAWTNTSRGGCSYVRKHHEQRTSAREHEQDTSTLQGRGLGKKQPASKLRQALDELVVFKVLGTHSLVIEH